MVAGEGSSNVGSGKFLLSRHRNLKLIWREVEVRICAVMSWGVAGENLNMDMSQHLNDHHSKFMNSLKSS